jgi:hypothetical protein
MTLRNHSESSILSSATSVSSLLGWSQDRENYAVASCVKAGELLHDSEAHQRWPSGDG